MNKFNFNPLNSLNLRQKTLLIIGLTLSLLILIFITSLTIDSNTITTNFMMRQHPPSFEQLFGTDWLGRDMLTRTLKGLGLSIMIGAFSSIISSIVAMIMAFISSINKYGDTLISWLIDLFASMPHLLLLILISLCMGKGALGVIVGVACTHWISLARVLRVEIKEINTSEYVNLARKFGKNNFWIAKEHILPLVITQIIVGTLLIFPHAIMHEASVTFLGFGLSPHEPAIGIILSESMSYLTMGSWWLALFPGLTLLIVVLLFDIIGEQVEKLLDPTKAQK
ncbi:MAG: ABC transporter permease [Methanosphaera stadtmanae]|jgi:peptide/nickel transport system permease protein|nr:ABC transporter permease [Methanosphaera stadtmanae]